VATAIRERDDDFIRNLAKTQEAGGAHFLDFNAGNSPDREPDDMVWLIITIQETCDLPLCLDSVNPAALKAGIEVVNISPMINSVSGKHSESKVSSLWHWNTKPALS